MKLPRKNRKLLIVRFGIEEKCPPIVMHPQYTSHKYDEVRVVRREDLSLKEQFLMMSDYDVFYQGPRSIIKHVVANWLDFIMSGLY